MLRQRKPARWPGGCFSIQNNQRYRHTWPRSEEPGEPWSAWWWHSGWRSEQYFQMERSRNNRSIHWCRSLRKCTTSFSQISWPEAGCRLHQGWPQLCRWPWIERLDFRCPDNIWSSTWWIRCERLHRPTRRCSWLTKPAMDGFGRGLWDHFSERNPGWAEVAHVL